MADQYWRPGDPAPSTEAITFASADVDSIKTSVATVTSAQTYSSADLDGAIGAAYFNTSVPKSGQKVTIYLVSQVGAYAASNYSIIGLDESLASQVESIANTDTAGGLTLTGSSLFTKVVSIVTPVNTSTGGELQFGTAAGDSPYLQTPNSIYVGGEGAIGYISEFGESIAAFPVAQGYHPRSVKRIYGTADGTTASSIQILKYES